MAEKMIQNKMKIVKDGSKIRFIVVEVDTSRPAVQVIGHTYSFNSKIVADKSFSADEFSKQVGFNFKKGELEWNV